LAAASACHCSRVIVRYHGTDALVAVEIAPGLKGCSYYEPANDPTFN